MMKIHASKILNFVVLNSSFYAKHRLNLQDAGNLDYRTGMSVSDPRIGETVIWMPG